VFDERDAPGVMVGFYSGDALEGVISHPGERFHVHYANRDVTRSGHVDGYSVRAGARLLLPGI
jgi:alpha-acetolactate decarboxylase